MKKRILGGKRRRRVLLGALAPIAALAALLVSSALAVHELDFELDGNVVVDSGDPPFDWASFFNASGQEAPALPDDSRQGFTASSFDKDFVSTGTPPNATFSTSDTTTFATGSKDILPITPPPGGNEASGWQCNFDNNVNSKIDINNAYALAYTDPASGDEILYFGLERNTNNGDANVAFWFLQDEVGCESTGGAASFSGQHQDGDLLVVSAFTRGGDVPNVDVYRWNDPDPDDDDPGSLGTTAVITGGADCSDDPSGPADDACGIVNTPATQPPDGSIDTPWDTATKTTVRRELDATQFYEGGVNLTNRNLGGRCFNTFIADTRSSSSLTATLFDYSLGQLGECAATMTTQVSKAGPVLPGEQVRDTAIVTGNKDITPTGTVTFYLCSFATGSTDVCDGTTGKVGTSIGTGTLAVGGSVNIATANSPFVNTSTTGEFPTHLTPGRYCFRAEWPGDTNYTTALKEWGAADTPAGTTECFTVKDTSSITTAQKWLPQDEATVTTAGGTAVSGTVVFSLYENGDCSGTAARTFTDTTVATGGKFETDNSTYYTESKTISWSATFTPSDTNAVQGSTTTRCEKSVLTIDNSASAFPPPTP